MKIKNWKWNLQFFGGEGASSGGDGGGDGASATGVISGDADQNVNTATNQTHAQSLEELGVPKAKAERYRKAKGNKATAASSAPAQVNNVPAEAPAKDTDEPADQSGARNYDKEFNDFLADPEMNQRMQSIISKRVKGSQEVMGALKPALEVIAKQSGIDLSKLDAASAKSLSDAIIEKSGYYEDLAAEMGSDVETAKRVSERERDAARREEEAKNFINEQKYQEYKSKIEQQSAAMRQKYPGFDLNKELQNPTFANVVKAGLSIEDAYHAVHHREIENSIRSSAAQMSAQALSNSIQSGRNVPSQNGSTSRASQNVAPKLYSQMTKEERAAVKAQYQREYYNRRR